MVTVIPAPNVTLDRGDNVTITCNTTAGPNNTFYWLKLGQDKACCPGGQAANITGKKNVPLLIII